jgi:hypothetical protein
MQLTNLTLIEKNNLLNDMDLFGYFDREEIGTFIEEGYLDTALVNKIGAYLSRIHTNQDFNTSVYNYIVNINDVQTFIRYTMNRKIIRDKDKYVEHYVELASNNNIIIDREQILSIVLKWYNSLYDLAGILEAPCLGVLLRESPLIFDYDEQIYNMMLEVCSS